MAICLAFLLNILTAGVLALPQASVKRQISHLREGYDFVIAGGGTSGLVVADRLSEAFPKKTVLVVEYGEIEYAAGSFDPPAAVWGTSGTLASRWSVQSLPNPEVRNKTATAGAGKVVGGSSAINGMYFDRPSRFDYEAWQSTGSPEWDEERDRWDWEAVSPFMKKSATFTKPSADAVRKYGYTWDESAFGGTTPIYSSFPPFLWADHPVVRGAWRDMGIPELRECGGGDKDGLCWVPISEHPVTARRSHSGIGHYAAVNATRPNYDLLVGHQVVRVVYTKGVSLTRGAPLVEVRSVTGSKLFNITVNNDVVISAGVFHTPTILQRSGIGPAAFLKSIGVPVVLDLPGVGANFQDHSGPAISWNYTKPANLPAGPMPTDLLNATFAADAIKGFDEAPARGPYTLAMSNSAIYVSLPNITSNYSDITSRILAMVAGGTAASYLPPDYRSDPALVAGYHAQLLALADFYDNPRAPSLEATFATGTAMRLVLLHPLSRGTVRLDPAAPLDLPLVDYRSGSNPVDLDLHVAHVRFARAMVDTPTMQRLGAVEVGPAPGVDDVAALREYVKDTMTLSFFHPCCTASMLPKRKGGVVGPDLKVHGAPGLRVVDMSVLPFLPSAHLSALAYAVGEKAADIMIKDWTPE